ncbi:MAG: trypsin-like peptidase domain-containing protein [Chloroflexi bacterium]|nr:trypsin-like peptidase domain-containing protein [Chloroflexota bacterium]
MVGKTIRIDPMSFVSIFIEACRGERSLASGTGFIVQKSGRSFLVTNWHMLAGRDPRTSRPLAETGEIPDKLAIWHHIRDKLGTWGRRFVPLTRPDGSPAWLEHSLSRKVDVVALPLTVDEEVTLYPLDLGLANTDLMISPSEAVSIIGFPFGLSAGGRFPIWKTGHVASDIDLDYDGLPIFLIDATTKPGMSGSPVIARRYGWYLSSEGYQGGSDATRFLGIYSGRIHESADVGSVWKPEVLNEIIR